MAVETNRSSSIVGRALADTRHQLGGLSGIIVLVLGLLGGVALHGFIFGQPAMMSQWPAVVSALAAYALLCLLFLIYNACAAPFRIERDHRLALEEAVSRLEKSAADLELDLSMAREEAPDIRLSLIFVMRGGYAPEFPDHIGLGASLRVSNRGKEASALDAWALRVIPKFGDPITLPLLHVTGVMELGSVNGQSLSFEESELIYVKTRNPVLPGTIHGGFILGLLSRAQSSALVGASLEVACVDVRDRRITTSHPIRSDDGCDEVGYSPLVNARIARKNEEEADGDR